ncbi:MAG: hypothetical protein ACLTDV_09320 [Eubacterium sp.]
MRNLVIRLLWHTNDWVEANHYQELNDAQKNWLYRQELGYIESLKGMTVREIAEQRIEEITTALRKIYVIINLIKKARDTTACRQYQGTTI